jgi:hypothetical protein
LIAVAPAASAHADTGSLVPLYVEGSPTTSTILILNYMAANGIPTSGVTFAPINNVAAVVMVPQAVRDHFVNEYNSYLAAVSANPTSPPAFPADMTNGTQTVMSCVRNGSITGNPTYFTQYAASTLAQQAMHASAFTNAGFAGQGVDVALIDGCESARS